MGCKTRPAEGHGAHPLVLRLPDQKTIQVRLLRVSQHQHLPQQHGRRAAVDGTGARQRHRHRLSHLRVADDRAAALQALYTNPTFIREEDYPLVAELVDWLIEKQKSGYHMVNSVERLAQMKDFIQGELEDWNCRAGHNSLVVRVDGTLAPCFPMYSAGYDWGTIENHKFESKQLKDMKKECQKNCFSTLNHILAFCYNDRRVINWLFKQAKHGFQGVKGNFGDSW